MMKTEQHEFQPDWISVPGDTISDILEDRHISPPEFAARIGCTVEQTKDLLLGRQPVTNVIAQKLEQEFGTSAAFWMSRESQYRGDLLRVGHKWLDELPLNDMIKFGWIKASHSFGDRIAACFNFFDVPDVTAWRERYYALTEKTAFRTSPSFESDLGAVATWLRQGEIESASINCKSWDAEMFKKALIGIRTLTRERDPNIFIPELKKRCADCGIAVVVLRTPSRCRASGATHFLLQDKALLMLSFRFLSDDHFWFTFFHEAGHLLLHNKKAIFLEGAETRAEEEAEANNFATHTLVPDEFRAAMLNLPLNGREVIRFAKTVGISPGILVGQLQHYGRFTRRQLNNLKTRFAWTNA